MTDQLEQHTPIRTDVPISMHPDTLSGVGKVLNQPDTIGVHAYSAAREALKICHDSFGLLNDAEKATGESRPLSAAQRKEALRSGQDVRMVNGVPTLVVATDELVEAAQQAWARIGPSIDRRMKELKGLHQTLESRVAAAIDNPSRKTSEGLALAAEVRAHVKSMSDGDRLTFCMSAVDAGDKATVAAILHAQPFLSGLSPAAQDALRKRAAAQFAPVDSAQYDATSQAISRVMQAGNRLSARYSDIINRPESPRAVAAKKVRALAGK
ncbi:hypothetical protein ACVIGA_003451 [Bradyrhizobium sp. USDA 3240]